MSKYKILIFIGIALFFKLGCAVKSKSGKRVIVADKIIQNVTQNKHVYYKDVTIKGDLDFTKAGNTYQESLNVTRVVIGSSITFINCTFEGAVTAFKALPSGKIKMVQFEKNLTFERSTFQDKVNLNEVLVDNAVNFTGSTFEQLVSFEGATYKHTKNNFNEVTFKEEVRGQRVVIRGESSWLNTKFMKTANFQNAIFYGDSQFGNTVFSGYADFSNVKSYGGWLFNYADFQNRVTFENASFQGRADFIQMQLKQATDFTNAIFYSQTRLNLTTIQGVINFTNATFFAGKPIVDGLVKKEKTIIILDNAKFLTNQVLKLSDF